MRIALSIVLAMLLAKSAVAETFIVQDGVAKGQILLPADAPGELKLAAKELAEHLKLMTGATLATADDKGGELPAGSIRLAISPKGPKEPQRDGSEQFFVIDQTGKGVLIEGNSPVAVLYGGYQYLDDLGVRWFMPGEIGRNVPKRASIATTGQRKEVKPGFRFRSIWLNGNPQDHWNPATLKQSTEDYAYWMIRNRLQTGINEKRLPASLQGLDVALREGTAHNIRVIYKWKKISFADSPERFPLMTRNGKKERSGDRGQICFTNRQNVDDTVAWCLNFFDENPHMFAAPMSLSDTGGMCECDECTKANDGVDPSRGGDKVVWGFMNEVARRVNEAKPGKGIGFYAGYGAMALPPEGTKAEPTISAGMAHTDHNSCDLDDPSCPFNVAHLKKFDRLKATGADMLSRDYFMWTNFQPLAAINYIKTYHRLGCVGYNCEVMARSEQHMMVYWVLAQLAWNPHLDGRKLIEEYCSTYYGPAGGDVLSVVDAIETSVKKVPRITLGGFGSANEIMTDDLITFGRKTLGGAMGKAEGVQKQRVERFQQNFELFSEIAEAYRALFIALDDRRPETHQAALAAFEKAIKYYKDNNLNDICSTNIVPGWLERVQRTAVSLPAITPALHKALVGLDEEGMKREVFTLDVMPDKLESFTLLGNLWKFRQDIFNRGETDGWAAEAFDDAKWPQLMYGFFDEQGFLRVEGTYWYRNTFQPPAVPTGKRLLMRIGGLDDEGKIFINGKLAHHRLSIDGDDWKQSFEFDITDFVKAGAKNTIAIEGRNDYGKGGLWKPVAVYVR